MSVGTSSHIEQTIAFFTSPRVSPLLMGWINICKTWVLYQSGCRLDQGDQLLTGPGQLAAWVLTSLPSW